MKVLFGGATLALAIAMTATVITAAALTVSPADAKGCIKGAVVGGIAGHAAHHAFLGAVTGCVVGHHLANKHDNEAPAAGQNAAPDTTSGSAAPASAGKQP
jgi:hypothetical protein